jgi:hypothetical protein
MIVRRDLQDEMRNFILDQQTADRLLTGRIEPDDAPPGYAEVAALLRASACLTSVDPERELATVTAMAEEIRSHPSADAPGHGRAPMKRLTRAKITALVVGGTLMATTGLAFAGALPAPVQGVASTMLAKIGITVPGPDPHAGTHPDSHGPSGADAASSASPGSRPTDTKGAQISNLARTTAAMGVAKGAIISSAASDGMSQAGTHGQAGTQHGQASTQHGQASTQHGQASTQHGQAGSDHGRSHPVH